MRKRLPSPFLLLAALVIGAGHSPLAQQAYTTIFYKSGALRIEAYLYKPTGAGPFPVIVYNHGTRDGQDRTEQPFPFIGRLLTAAGYAVLVPERRGYGKSDGP